MEVNLSPFPNKLIRHQYLEIRAREAPTCCIFQVLETLQAQLHTPLTPPSLNIIIYVEVIINIIINIKKKYERFFTLLSSVTNLEYIHFCEWNKSLF